MPTVRFSKAFKRASLPLKPAGLTHVPILRHMLKFFADFRLQCVLGASGFHSRSRGMRLPGPARTPGAVHTRRIVQSNQSGRAWRRFTALPRPGACGRSVDNRMPASGEEQTGVSSAIQDSRLYSPHPALQTARARCAGKNLPFGPLHPGVPPPAQRRIETEQLLWLVQRHRLFQATGARKGKRP